MLSAPDKSAIYIRTDANQRVGMGHLVRCLALTELVGPAYAYTFVMRAPAPAVQHQVHAAGHALLEVPVGLALEHEPGWLHEHLRPADILVLDGYDFSQQYQRRLKKRALALVCLDDLVAPSPLGDVIINQAGGVSAADYHPEPGTQLCLGPAFALLRRPFREAALHANRRDTTNRIFLNLGGADPDNHTLTLLRSLRARFPAKQLVVVTGPAYPHQALLRTETTAMAEVEIYHNVAAAPLAELLSSCGIYVCPPSGMAYECCAVGGLVALHPIAENQLKVFDYLVQQGLAIPYTQLIALPNAELPVLAVALQAAQKLLFDNQTGERLQPIFRELNRLYTLTVRRAQLTDAAQYFDWVNDPDVRRNALQSNLISWPEHETWFARRLADADAVLYLFHWLGSPVGQVRFEFEGSQATIDYSLDERWRGKRLGKLLLRRALLELRRERPEAGTLVGVVKSVNKASARVFEQLGFTLMPSAKEAEAGVLVYKLAVNSGF